MIPVVVSAQAPQRLAWPSVHVLPRCSAQSSRATGRSRCSAAPGWCRWRSGSAYRVRKFAQFLAATATRCGPGTMVFAALADHQYRQRTGAAGQHHGGQCRGFGTQAFRVGRRFRRCNRRGCDPGRPARRLPTEVVGIRCVGLALCAAGRV